jgi:hypothetical protein
MKYRLLLTFVVLLIFSLGNFMQVGRASIGRAFVQTGPILSVDDTSVAEGNSGTLQLNFTVRLTGAHPAVTVRVATADGIPPNGATAPSDYLSNVQFLNFSAGEATSTQTFAVTINGDTTVEPDETFFVNLSNADGATIGDGQAVGFILNDDGSSCSFSISPTSADFPANGGTASVTVTTTTGCSWTATSNAPWITVTNTSIMPTGGTVSYSVAANTGADRSGSMTIAGQTFTVNQEGVDPTISISDAVVTEGNNGTANAVFTVSLSAPVASAVTVNYSTADNTAMTGDNDYTAASGTVTFPANNNAPQTVSVQVTGDTRNEPDEIFLVNLRNPSSGTTLGDSQGTGTIVNDDNLGNCAYSISPISQHFSANSGSGSIAVTAPEGCNWSAASNNPWIRITAGANGAGNGVVTYTVDTQSSFPTVPARTGSITIANKSFNISQDGTMCEFQLSARSQNFSAAASTGSFQVNAAADCEWEAALQLLGIDPVPFVALTSGTGEVRPFIRGRGNGTVNFSVQANSSIFSRSKPIMVNNRRNPTTEGVAFVVQQAAAASECSYQLSPENVGIDAEANLVSFSINTLSGCSQTVVSNVDWITVFNQPIPGLTNCTLEVRENRGNWRAGSVTIGNRNFFVYQDGVNCPIEMICAFFPSACGLGIEPVSRQFRDDVLVKTSRGQNYTKLYYQAANEAVQILTLNPMLLLRSSEILQRYKPTLEAMSRGEQVTLSEGDLAEIDDFLNSFAAKGSEELRQSIHSVRKDLHDSQVHKEFNIMVIKGEKRQLSSTHLSGRKWAAGFALLSGFCPIVVFGFRRRRKLAKGAKLLLLFALSLAVTDLMPLSSIQAQPRTRTTAKPIIKQTPAQANPAYAKLPLAFEPNVGQADPQSQFIARGKGYTLALKPTEAKLALRSQKAAGEGERQKAKGERQIFALPTPDSRQPTADELRLKLVAANPAATIEGLDELAGKSNYFIGNDPAKWRAGVANYAKVKCADVYSGVDLIYYGNGGELEYDFQLAAGADFKTIALQFEGAEAIKLAANGELILQMANGEVRQHKPVAYQQINGVRKPVACNYRWLNGVGKASPRTTAKPQPGHRTPDTGLQTPVIGFAVGAYDPSQPLIIDPVLVYATYLGGSGDDEGNSITVDAAGNVYVAGFTNSINFPTANAAQPTQGGGQQDAFVAKLNPAGSALLYSTYFGGGGQDNASSIAVDAAGNAYITGYTISANFPVKDALQAGKKGSSNAFVMKLNPSGGLLYATHMGGNASDAGTGIAVDAAGNIYVAGIATSADFPTLNAAQANWGGAADAFVAKLNPSGSQLLFSTYIGATSSDAATSLAVDSSGNAYVTGVTTSRNWQTASPLQANHGGGLFDVFVAKFNIVSRQLVYSTYIGGGGEDRAFRIAVDAAGNAYITGDTDSTNFPTANALQSSHSGGATDAFVAKLNAAGSALVYSTYMGGGGIDGGTALAVNGAGEAYVTGFTGSKNFPAVSPLQAENGGGAFDAFIAKLNAAGSQLDYSTYMGGANIDAGFGIAVDAAGNAYVMGVTASQNFPTANPLQRNFGGGAADLFIARIAIGLQLNGASINGKRLTVFGNGFDNGAKILVNGQEQKTGNDEQSPTTILSSPKAAKRIPQAQTTVIQVRNADGKLSNQLSFRR